MRHLERSNTLLDDRTEQLLGEVHVVDVVPVGCVILEHREVLQVRGIHTLVAEHPCKLINTVESRHHAALQISLWCDPQVYRHVESCVVSLEGSRQCSRWLGLQHRRLDLIKISLFQTMTKCPDEIAAQSEASARLLVGNQVEVATTVADFSIGDGMKLFRHRTQHLAE